MSDNITRNGNTLTNHDLGKTYTYGVRGRKAQWVVDWENKNEKPLSVTNVVDSVTTEHKITFDSKTQTLTNHTLDKTYTFGQRGKRATWVTDWITTNPTMAPEKPVSTGVTRKNNNGNDDTGFTPSANGLREWHFRSEMNIKAIVVATSVSDAMLIINSIQRHSLGDRAFATFWKETDYVCDLERGMWHYDSTTDSWEDYKEYKAKINELKSATVAKIIETADEQAAIADAMIDAAEDEEIVEDLIEVGED